MTDPYFEINRADGAAMAQVDLVPHDGYENSVEIPLPHDAFAYVDTPTGKLLGAEFNDTTVFGNPFDQPAAERAIAWVREQLAARAAS